jgi:hypothetical protein
MEQFFQVFVVWGWRDKMKKYVHTEWRLLKEEPSFPRASGGNPLDAQTLISAWWGPDGNVRG